MSNITIEQLVQREVIYCVSTLISELAKQELIPRITHSGGCHPSENKHSEECMENKKAITNARSIIEKYKV